ncbi:MAG: M1 family metallopeptidase [Saprospiraceae bacterium]
MKRIYITVLLSILGVSFVFGQYTRQDTLRGSITPQRAWWDLNYYHLDISLDPDKRWIEGSNTILFTALREGNVIQIDLQEPLVITSAIYNNKKINVINDGRVYYVHLTKKLKKGDTGEIKINYEGNPKEAKRPPWDGGVTYRKDANGNHFIATSCQGLGASVWWPCKDHMYDEVDSMLMSITVPKNLIDVSNGVLRNVDNNRDGTRTFHWFVNNPINNYGVNINIGNYTHWQEIYQGEKGPLRLDYYPLKVNEEKARKQWKEVVPMMEAFEHWFGPYPFYEDGYKLVEAPYLGMEHQSSITYGNGFQNGYLGRDLSGTGYGLLFDFIIIHESGHEWFANNITYKDIADMWIHESFTNYSESLYLEYHHGKKAGYQYVLGTRTNIKNDKPIIGPYGVNSSGSGDMYYKGGNMLHTLRQWVNDDDKWRMMLRGLNETFFHKTVSTADIESYMSNTLELKLKPFFDQYLRDIRIPTLEYYQQEGTLRYRWTAVNDAFSMPVNVTINGEKMVIEPTALWKTKEYEKDIKYLDVDRNYYVRVMRVR